METGGKTESKWVKVLNMEGVSVEACGFLGYRVGEVGLYIEIRMTLGIRSWVFISLCQW